MTPLQKKVLGNVLGAAVNAAVLFLDPKLQPVALMLWGFIAGALHISRPEDSTPVQVETSVRTAALLARNTSASVKDITADVSAESPKVGK